MYRGRKLSHINIELLSRTSIRKKGITYALKILNVQMCYFSRESFLIPTELQIEGCSNPHKIPPVVYAHLLRFLCHYHLGKNRQCRESITDLQVTITEGYFIEEKKYRIQSYILQLSWRSFTVTWWNWKCHMCIPSIDRTVPGYWFQCCIHEFVAYQPNINFLKPILSYCLPKIV